MGTVFEGHLDGKGLRVGIVASRFNELITRKLLDGALDALRRHAVAEDAVDVAWAPGAFELPLVADHLAASGRYDAIICLGAVIRGQTAHFDYVAGESAKGIAQVGLQRRLPVIYGVLTCESIEQAIDRAGARVGNRGADAALAAIEMARLLRSIDDES